MNNQGLSAARASALIALLSFLLSGNTLADVDCSLQKDEQIPYELLLGNLLLGTEMNQTSQDTLKRLNLNILTDLAYADSPLIKDPMIDVFIKLFDIDVTELLHPDIGWYKNFNAFFTRSLKPGARTIDPDINTLTSPVDGLVSETGRIDGLQMIQAKGKLYSLVDLLHGNDQLAEAFFKGSYVTFYLSPSNYHRVHMPFSGTLRTLTSIPGTLHRVDPRHAESINNLYAVNERMIAVFDGDHGPFIMVLVGAENVGRIETSWMCIKPGMSNKPVTIDYQKDQPPVRKEKGEEMGLFNLGSTVILLFPEDQGTLELKAGEKVRMGEKVGHY
ncbi:archaetidylserine decarboxylase [Endozoicomonas arenosclerae]|uniref:archaetidylserine decarboxylase n=1 Tax=Endozoicomonas arenosclerae TaxID=1633495 RepID=UPI0007837180|nr:archaetidylserine decarboxylase [Endozoicomonas arenosclerae]